MKKHFFAAFLLAGALVTSAPATLVITEINSNSTVNSVQVDFWELTNVGASTIDLSNWVWDDSLNSPTDPKAARIPSGTSIASGESIVFIVLDKDFPEVTVESFRAAWNLSANVQVFASLNPGLGKDDGVSLFDANGVSQLFLSYAQDGFTRSNGEGALGGHAGTSAGGSSSSSMIIDPTFAVNDPRYTAANGSNFGSWANANGEFGSPGYSGLSAVPEPGTVALVALGLGVFGWQHSRRRRLRA